MYLIFLYYLLPVFLPYTVATAACEPSEPTQPPLRPALPPDWDPLSPSGGILDLKPRSQGDASGDAAERIRGPALTSATGESAEKRGGARRAMACVAGQVESVTPGRVYVSGQLEVTRPSAGYQADSAGQERVRGQRVSGQRPGPSELWQRLQPAVECGDSAMTVTFRRRRASQVLLDRANESSVPLTRPPPRCGYSVQTTWRDLRLMAQYGACHVTRKHDSYELPLLWRETPVKVSCPVSHVQSQSDGSPSVCCSAHSMSVKMQGAPAAELLRVKVRGQWTPLIELVEPCGFTLDEQDGEITITAPFITCGIAVMNGKHTLSIQLGDKKFMLACPVSTPEEPTLSPEVVLIPDPPLETEEHSPESMKPFVWTPPFYLAPPLYPHPTYHKYHHPDRPDPSTSSPPTPAPTFNLPSFPPVGFLPEYQDNYFHPDSLNEYVAHHSTSTRDTERSGQVVHSQQAPLLSVFEQHRVTHSPSRYEVQVESPPLVPPTPAHNQYYHNYRHPPNPRPDTLQHAAPAPVAESSPSDAAGQFNMDDHATYPQAVLPNEWYPPHPYSDHHPYQLPHKDAFKLPPVNPDLPTIQHPDWRGYEPLSDKTVEAPGPNADVSPPEQTSSPSTNVPPPPFYPLLHHSQMYYGPDHSLSSVSQIPSNDDSQLRTFGPQFTSPVSEPKYDVHHVPLYHYAQPEVSADDQDVPHQRDTDTKSESELPSVSAHGFTVWPAGYPSILQAGPPLYVHHVSEAYPDAPDELLDNEMEESTAHSHSELRDVACTLQRLTSDPSTYVAECGLNQDVETLGLLTEYASHQQDLDLEFFNPARLAVEHGSPGEVRLRPAHRPTRSTEASVAAQLRIATDQTFTSFHPEARLPLSLIRGKPVYVQVSLLGPPEPGMVLLVHSCWAYTETAYPSWKLIYDGCPSRSAAQLLPSPHSHHIRRIVAFSFSSPFSESPTSFNKRDFHPEDAEDPEVHFLCSIGACFALEGDCIEGCINRYISFKWQLPTEFIQRVKEEENLILRNKLDNRWQVHMNETKANAK